MCYWSLNTLQSFQRNSKTLKTFKSNVLKSKHLQTSQTSFTKFKSFKSCVIEDLTPSKLSNEFFNTQNIQIKCLKF